MLYDIRGHLPQILGGFMESFRAGEINQLETGKILVSKIFNDTKLNDKIKIIDTEHKIRKDKIEMDLRTVEEKRNNLIKQLGENEASYWETILGEFMRTNNNIPSPIVEPEDE